VNHLLDESVERAILRGDRRRVEIIQNPLN
jgi:hypothetical protein